MKKYDIGDIVFVSNYDYDNGEKGSNHLFVIIDEETLVAVEYFGLIVSSRIEKSKKTSLFKFNEILKKNDVNGLNKDSIVKCDQLYNFSEKNILFKIGHVDVDDFLRFMNAYEMYLKTLENKQPVS